MCYSGDSSGPWDCSVGLVIAWASAHYTCLIVFNPFKMQHAHVPDSEGGEGSGQAGVSYSIWNPKIQILGYYVIKAYLQPYCL